MNNVLIYDDKNIDDMTIKESIKIFDNFSYSNGIFKGIKKVDNTINRIKSKQYERALSYEYTKCPSDLSEEDELKTIKKLKLSGKTQTEIGEIIGKSQPTISRKLKKIKNQENKLIIQID